MKKMSFTTFGTQPHLNTLHMYNKIHSDWPCTFLILLLNFDWLPAFLEVNKVQLVSLKAFV